MTAITNLMILNESPCRIISGMDITELLSTNDPDTLRQMALSLLEENRKKDASLSEKDHQIRLLKEALMLARQQRFGPSLNPSAAYSVPCSKRMPTRISLLLKRSLRACRRSRKKRKPVPSVNRCWRTCRAKKRLLNQSPPPARTAASRCVISAMKSASGWTTSRRSSW